MSRPAEETSPFNPRMHRGGKLSFRRRQPRDGGDGGPLLRVGGEDPPALRELVPGSCTAVAVEIGPGKGAFLLAASERDPDTFWLGIEAAQAYAQVAAGRLQAAGRANALLLVDNARMYLEDRVPEGALAAVHVYFPDPWPKRRHKGRRFFTPDMPATLGRVLRDGGLLYVATDNAAYAGQICRVMGASRDFDRAAEEERRAAQSPPGVAFSPTNFETKYQAEGRVIRRYAFRRRPR